MEMFILKNGTVWDGLNHDPVKADILVKDGKIAKIAESIECDRTQIVDVEDCMVLPGFIDSLNVYGCRGPGWGVNDIAEGADPVLPQMNAVFAFDQDGMNFQEIYRYGVTASGISPMPSNVLAGKAAVFYSYGRNPYKMLLKEEAAQIASVSGASKKLYGPQNKMPMTRMGTFSLLKEALVKAQQYDKAKGYDAKREALLPVLHGQVPLFVNCATKAEMKGILHMLQEFPQVKPVLTGAFCLDTSFTQVADGQVPVILGDLTDAFSPYGKLVDFEAVKELLNQGAVIACSSCGDSSASGKESLLWNGIQWYKHGIEANLVLQAMTSTPARLLGVDRMTGSLEVGKNADIVVWTGNPIRSYRAGVKAVYIKGENILEKERYASCW